MEKVHYCFHLGVLFLNLQLACLAMTTTNITTDQLALLALRENIIISSETHQILANNWSVKASACEWIGVTCGSRHRRVTALNVSNMGLTATIPSQLGNLSFLVSLDMSRNNFHGRLPLELSHLRRLRVLDFGFNNFTGELPSCFGSLQKLQYLSLRNNSFTGVIPHSISNMSNLEILSLSFNSLEGRIPKGIGNLHNLRKLMATENSLFDSVPSEIFNISSLEFLGLYNNSLSGSLPDNMCLRLQRLTLLSLSYNYFHGQIPTTLSECASLQVLSLSFNNFNGSIPKGIGELKQLEQLYLGHNNFSGSIPKEIGDLKQLQQLFLAENSFTGEIPKEIGNLTMIKAITIFSCNLKGSIPVELGKLYNLEVLGLSMNSLSGSIPAQIFNISTVQKIGPQKSNLFGMVNLYHVELGQNDLDGSIPMSISNASKIIHLDISGNKLSGVIPNSLGDLRFLQYLDISDNNLRSDPSTWEMSFINSLTNCDYLTKLAMSSNPFGGAFPVSVGNLSKSIERIYAYNCELKGNIPDSFGNLSNLLILNLFGNHLTGPIPATVGGMQNVQYLTFDDNLLTGPIPENLCDLKNLFVLLLSQNQISGSIPSCLGNVTSLRYIYIDQNVLNSGIPSSLWNLMDLMELNLSSNFLSGSLPLEIQNLKAATLISLSANRISGNIPSSIGELKSLTDLHLDQNILEGSIPESISHMLSLQFLDLSYNNLSGIIPKSFEDLRYLLNINLSFNNLRGEIPSGGPFKNFTSQSFMFNDALCGAPQFLMPPCSTSQPHKTSRKKMLRVIYILLGAVAAVFTSTTFMVVFLRYRKKNKVPKTPDSLLIRTAERISYYELLQATNGYDESNLLGIGSYGFIYKGILKDGRLVAVKVFNLQKETAFKSFEVECEVFRNLRHRNLTKVIGSCSNNEFKALVLEYMANGSLEKWLYTENHFLDMLQRLNIMLDVARALEYLHYGYTTQVVHCDLKPSNILLDENMAARVSDFGITKMFGEGESVLHTKTLATLGYVAPEYGLEGMVSARSDVYSLGIVMMETFSRMKPSDEKFSDSLSLKSWIENSLPNAAIQVIDANLLQPDDGHLTEKQELVMQILELALKCCTEHPADRTNMKDVVGSLERSKHQLLKFS